MSSEEEKKEAARIKRALYDAGRKEELRINSLRQSRARTLVTTANRIKGHSLDELIKVAQLCCTGRESEFYAKKDVIIDVFRFLLGHENVQSTCECSDIVIKSSDELSTATTSDQQEDV